MPEDPTLFILTFAFLCCGAVLTVYLLYCWLCKLDYQLNCSSHGSENISFESDDLPKYDELSIHSEEPMMEDTPPSYDEATKNMILVTRLHYLQDQVISSIQRLVHFPDDQSLIKCEDPMV